MWGSVLDDMKGYRSPNSTASPTPDDTARSPTLRSSLSRRFSFVRRSSLKHTAATPSIVYTPSPAIAEQIEDPLAAVGATLASPPMPPSAFNPEDSEISTAGASNLHAVPALSTSTPPIRKRPVSFAPDIREMAAAAAGNPVTPGSERPTLERRRSRRERLVAGLNRSFSLRSTSYDSSTTGASTIDGRLSRGVGSVRRQLSRSYSSSVARMPTEAEITALENQRASSRYPYDTEYDYMGSMAYCDGMWFNEYLEDD